MKYNSFLLILSLFIISQQLFAQDHADKARIEEIRLHYYAFSNHPEVFKKYSYEDGYQAYKKDNLIQKIVWEEGEKSYEAYFDGEKKKLNFLYLIENGKESRFYFRHMEDGDPFPFMERFVDAKGNYHQLNRNDYWDKNLEMSALAMRAFNKVEFEEKIEPSLKLKKVEAELRRTAVYLKNIERIPLRMEKLVEELEELETEEPQAAAPYTESYFDEAGRKVKEVYVESGDIGCAISNDFKQEDIYRDGALILRISTSSVSYFGLGFQGYAKTEIADGLYYKVRSIEREYFSNGESIWKERIHRVSDKDFWIDWE